MKQVRTVSTLLQKALSTRKMFSQSASSKVIMPTSAFSVHGTLAMYSDRLVSSISCNDDLNHHQQRELIISWLNKLSTPKERNVKHITIPHHELFTHPNTSLELVYDKQLYLPVAMMLHHYELITIEDKQAILCYPEAWAQTLTSDIGNKNHMHYTQTRILYFLATRFAFTLKILNPNVDCLIAAPTSNKKTLDVLKRYFPIHTRIKKENHPEYQSNIYSTINSIMTHNGDYVIYPCNLLNLRSYLNQMHQISTPLPHNEKILRFITLNQIDCTGHPFFSDTMRYVNAIEDKGGDIHVDKISDLEPYIPRIKYPHCPLKFTTKSNDDTSRTSTVSEVIEYQVMPFRFQSPVNSETTFEIIKKDQLTGYTTTLDITTECVPVTALTDQQKVFIIPELHSLTKKHFKGELAEWGQFIQRFNRQHTYIKIVYLNDNTSNKKKIIGYMFLEPFTISVILSDEKEIKIHVLKAGLSCFEKQIQSGGFGPLLLWGFLLGLCRQCTDQDLIFTHIMASSPLVFSSEYGITENDFEEDDKYWFNDVYPQLLDSTSIYKPPEVSDRLKRFLKLLFTAELYLKQNDGGEIIAALLDEDLSEPVVYPLSMNDKIEPGKTCAKRQQARDYFQACIDKAIKSGKIKDGDDKGITIPTYIRIDDKRKDGYIAKYEENRTIVVTSYKGPEQNPLTASSYAMFGEPLKHDFDVNSTSTNKVLSKFSIKTGL